MHFFFFAKLENPHLIHSMHFLLSRRRLEFTFEKDHPSILGVSTRYAENKKNDLFAVLGEALKAQMPKLQMELLSILKRT